MADLFATVEGEVFGFEHKEGTTRAVVAEDGTTTPGRPYSLDILKVLVPGAGITELMLPELGAAALGGVLYTQETVREMALRRERVAFLVRVYGRSVGYGVTILETLAVPETGTAFGSHALETV